MDRRRREYLYLLVVLALMVSAALPAWAHEITLEKRVEAQRAIEQVYWAHRTWPADNPGPKPALAEVLPDDALRGRVEASLAKAALLDAFWHEPLSGEELQAEIDRMVKNTKAPDVLREIFAALGDDPLLIAECVARPALVDRRVAALFASDPRTKGQLYDDWASTQPQPRLASPDPEPVTPPEGGYLVPIITTTGCTDDIWTPIAPSVGAHYGRGVWTGAEMIVWGGANGSGGYQVTGERYRPDTDSWSPISTVNTPSARALFTSVWTGTQMIVWGGEVFFQGEDPVYFNTGGRYSPATDTWSSTSTSGAPEGRDGHTAVWTGSRMIVWGGFYFDSFGLEQRVNNGGRYDPATNSWASTSTGANVPSKRSGHTAVWTGSEMIVWGGTGFNFENTGGRYNPTTNLWSAMTTAGAPSARTEHGAVWTGSKMFVWGGFSPPVRANDGGRYNPSTNSWVAIPNTVNAGVSSPELVWTGKEMIEWGGYISSGNYSGSGSRYDESANSWIPMRHGAGAPPNDPAQAFWITSHRMLLYQEQPGYLYCGSDCTEGATACSDGNLCTNDVCQDRACVSTPVVCTAPGPCYDAGTCNPNTGQCNPSPKPDGVACEDGNLCTAACPNCQLDTCNNGVCGCPNTPGICSQTSSYATQTIASSDVPKTISSAGPNTVTSTINVSIPGSPIVYDLDVRTFLRHTSVDNIDMTVRSPAGTVVTLTTDNGGGNESTFFGTVWDDGANPGGQVPYGSNGGLVTDRNYSRDGTVSPLVPEEPLGAFNGENPNGVWTLTISDDTTGAGGSLDNWSLTLATIAASAPTSTTVTYTGTQVPLTISAANPSGTSSAIHVSGAGFFIGKVRATTDITHTNNADIDMTLTSPAGTVVTLTTDNGGTADNVFHTTTWDDDANPGGQVPYSSNNGLASDHAYVNLNAAALLAPEEGLAAFRGENPNGTWTLKIVDDTAGNDGTLNAFSLQITTMTCPLSCQVDCSDTDGCTTDTCSPSLGCQHACNAVPSCIPAEIANVHFGADDATLSWNPSTGGATAVHDVARGRSDQYPPGSGGATQCLAAGIPGTTVSDTAKPPVGKAFWYDIRGRNICGAGPWGNQSNGTPRTIDACP